MSRTNKINVRCPHCGHEQSEPRIAKSTYCRACSEYFTIEHALRAAKAEKPPTRIVVPEAEHLSRGTGTVPLDAPTLREPETDREKVAEDVAKQRQRLGELQERMKNTIGEAEDAEPILSQRLYEAVRNVQDRKVEERLQQTERAVRQGAAQQAQQQEAAAGEGLKQLRQAVDRAAEGVLGEGVIRIRLQIHELVGDRLTGVEKRRAHERYGQTVARTAHL